MSPRPTETGTARDQDRKDGTMADKKDAKTTSRRDFLKVAGVAAPAVVASVAAGKPAQAEALLDTTKKTGLRDTEHTRAYYKAARF